MSHEFYVNSAYAISFLVTCASSAHVWLTGRRLRSRVKALVPVRRRDAKMR